MPAMLTAILVNTRFLACTSFTPRPMTAGFGLGTRHLVRMRTRLENGVLRNGQQPQSVVNGFQGKFEAMKMLSGWEAACCDEHQFRAKIKVST